VAWAPAEISSSEGSSENPNGKLDANPRGLLQFDSLASQQSHLGFAEALAGAAHADFVEAAFVIPAIQNSQCTFESS
jgi:hypothetical protein